MDSDVQRYKRKKIAYKVDLISELSDDVLLLILSRLSTKEAIRMSVVSKRWKHVWKQMPHLVLNTRRSINPRMLRRRGDSNPDAELTRVLSNHYGDLESCEITHSSHKGVHGLLETWIQTVETKNLILVNQNHLRPCSFHLDFLSHLKLTSLSLNSYLLFSSIPFFQNWSNIKTLKLLSIFSYEIGVFNNVLASCPSLEVLVLNVGCTDRRGRSFTLKIENSKLKFLELNSIYDIDKVIVSAPNLDILVAENAYLPERELLLHSPNLRFNENPMARQPIWLHIFYNISKEENNGHEDLVNRINETELRRKKCPTLSVAVDLMNETEVERLRQFLCLWSYPLNHFEIDLEIKFKGHNALSPSEEELECWQKKLWVENDDDDPFPDAKFCVNVVVIYNFNASKEEIAFVSCLIRQRKVERRILINSNSFSASNMSNIEAAVAKLKRRMNPNRMTQINFPKLSLIYQ